MNKTLTGKMFLLKNNPHAKRNTCQDTEMKEFSADIARYRAMGDHGKDLWMNPAVWAIACYRFGNWLNVAKPVLIIRFPLKIVAYLANKFCEVFMEMCIDASATIGGGLYIAHIGGVHINPQAVSGKNCDIAHRVTIGTSAMGRKGAPTLGDEVYVGTGAALVGKIRSETVEDCGEYAGNDECSSRCDGDGGPGTSYSAGPKSHGETRRR